MKLSEVCLSERKEWLRETTDPESGASSVVLQESYREMNKAFPVYGERFIELLKNAGLAGDVIDAGCGNGYVACQILQAIPAVTSITGIDINEVAVSMANNQNDPKFTAFLGDVYAIDAEIGIFDAALLFDTLHHLARPVDALRQISSVLHPHGIVIIFDLARNQNAWEITSLFRRSPGLSDVQKSVLRGYTGKEIEKMLKGSGLQAREAELLLGVFHIVIAEKIG